MPSHNKENTAVDAPRHPYNMRKRARADSDRQDGCFVETAKKAIKRGCTELGIKKYASLSSMHEAHGSKRQSSSKKQSNGRRLVRGHTYTGDLSSEATVVALPSDDAASEDIETSSENTDCGLESQLTLIAPSSPPRIFEALDKDEAEGAERERSGPELAETYTPLLAWLLEIEAKHASGLSSGLMRHPELSARMRPILVDWLMEVAADYRMHRQTLHLTVQYLDRFLKNTDLHVRPSQLQCFGTACLSLAMKAEEQRVPTLSELTDFSKDAFTRDQLKAAEISVLTALSWHLAVPTLHEFLAMFFQRAALLDSKETQAGVLRWKNECPASIPCGFSRDRFAVACDYADLLLHCQEALQFRASELAAACFYVGGVVDAQVFGECTGMKFAKVWPAVRFIKRLKAAVSPNGMLALNDRMPCCAPKSRHGVRLKHIRQDELWAFQPHHVHLLDEFEAFFALRTL
ncbi:Cyclin-A2 [Linderina pennispora]|nr:Cyclin-A2 [Linderina pennispora]